MIPVIMRSRQPKIPLPFFPRSAGVNIYTSAGLKDNMKGITAVEICTVASGICAIEQNGVMVTLTADESIFKLPGEHRRKKVLSHHGAVVYWATFDGPHAQDFILSYGYPDGALHTGTCPKDLYQEISKNLLFSTDSAFRRLTALYTELIALLPGPEPELDQQDRLLSECILKIRLNYANSAFNIDALAATMGLHRTTLLRLFRKKLKCTPLEYLTQCRIRHAMELLRTSVIPVSEIAAGSGFSRCNYFSRVIRKCCGITPEQFRKLNE